MSAFLEAAAAFLTHRRVAVAGLSRDKPNPGNFIYRRLKQQGFDVFPVHPEARVIEGDACYPSLAEVPGGVDAVIVATHPDVTTQVVKDCVAAGVRNVWLHRSVGAGSVSAEAIALCEKHGVALLDGGCPLMVLEPDIVHRCMRWLLDARGRLPDGSRYHSARITPDAGRRQ
jgi:uncharacterized protein